MGLILPRNPFSYPGGRAGFDPNHLASKGVRLSLVASVGGPQIVMAPTGAMTLHGTVATAIRPTGPAITATATATNYISFPAPAELTTAVTYGVVMQPTVLVNPGVIFSNNGTTGGGTATALELVTNSSNLNMQLFVNGTSINSITVGPQTSNCFIALSYNGAVCNTVIARFDPALPPSTVSQTTVFPATFGTPTTPQYNLMSLGATGFPMNAHLSTFMYSANNFLSLPQLLQWAQAPYDFWYPQTARKTIFSSLKGGAAVDSISFALTDPVETAAFTLTEADKFHFALTDPVETAAFTLADAKGITFALTDAVETAAFTLTEKDQFHFALTDPVETAAFSLTKQESFHFALTDPVETAAFALTGGKTVHFALTDPVETAAFALTDTPPAPQPGPQIAFPLRERTYRRRFLGVGYDPKFVITKDRPGPIRIIEFIGEMKDD